MSDTMLFTVTVQFACESELQAKAIESEIENCVWKGNAELDYIEMEETE